MDRGEICGRTIVAIWRSAIIASCAGANRLSRRKQLVGEYFATVSGDDDWNPRYNIAPTQPVVTIRQGAEPTGLDLPVPLRRPQLSVTSVIRGIKKTLDLVDSLAGVIVANINESTGVL